MRPVLFGLAGFGAIVAVGLLLWFLVFKPDGGTDCAVKDASGECGVAVGPTTPAPTTTPPTIGPTTTPTGLPTASPTASPTTPPPSPSPSPTETPPPPPPGGDLSFLLGVCSEVTEKNECKGYTFRRNAAETRFDIRLIVYWAPEGKKVTIKMVDADRGSTVIPVQEFTTRGIEGEVFVVTVRNPGGIGRLTGEIIVNYAGKRIRFQGGGIARWR